MNWKDISLMPQNIPLETIYSGGNMFWFPDMSMYVIMCQRAGGGLCLCRTYLHNSNNYLTIC